MRLPIQLSFGKKEKLQYYLALVLREEKADAVIFEEVKGIVKVVGEHEAYFSDSIESATMEEFLDVLDKAISTAESSLPGNIETQKTIFGLKEEWVEDIRIKKQYKIKLQKATDALGLTPIAFMVVTEAITYLLQKEEGAPVSALLMEIGNRNLTVSLLRAGRIVEVKTTRIVDTLVETADRVLRHFIKQEVLPSRIILCNESLSSQKHEKNDNRWIQSFIGHSWSKSIPFLHVPQIKVLQKGFEARAVLVGAASQMGFEVLGEEQIEEKELHKSQAYGIQELEKEEQAEEKILQKEDEERGNREAESKDSIDELDKEEEYEEEAFGFVKDKDIVDIERDADTKDKKKSEDFYETVVKVEEEQKEKEYNHTHDHAKQAHQKNPSALFSYIIGMIRLQSRRLFALLAIGKTTHEEGRNGIRLPKIPFGNKLLIISFIIVLLFGVISYFYFFTLKAVISVVLVPKIIEKTQDVTFVADGKTDIEKNTIVSEGIIVTEEGSVSVQASGTKEIGDKAKGTVILYSKFTQEKTIPAGTAITSDNNLDFILDDVVKIASVSAGDASTSVEPKTVKISVTAAKIGKEYNLPSGTKFTVENFDSKDLIAKNDTAFSGGSRKSITTVSQADLDKLLKELPISLEGKAKNNLVKAVPADAILIPGITNKTIIKKDFDKKVGDESSQVTLKGSVSYQGVFYKKDSVDTFAKSLLANNIKDMVLGKGGITSKVQTTKEKNDKEITGKLVLKASFIPKVDKESLLKEVTGKSFDDAKQILEKIPQFANASFTLNPSLPFLPKVLPRVQKNITLSLEE